MPMSTYPPAHAHREVHILTSTSPAIPATDDSDSDESNELLSPHRSRARTAASRLVPPLFLVCLSLFLVLLVVLLVDLPFYLTGWSSLVLSTTGPPSSTSSHPSAFLWPPSSTEWPSNHSSPSPSPSSPSSTSLTPSPPSIAFVLRCYSGYKRQMAYLFRSMELFFPPSVLTDTLLILDDTEKERLYATLLPPWVKVRYEGVPPLAETWKGSVRGADYDQALYSNWVSDTHTQADVICTLDPDMVFVSRTALYSMLHYDAGNATYKPLLHCLGHLSGYRESHTFFSTAHLPHIPYCMAQLPVCIHRSTLAHVRAALTAQFRPNNPQMYLAHPDVDPFAVTYSLLSHSYQHGEAICQYCIWSTYVMSDPAEAARYVIGIGAQADYTAQAISTFNAQHAGGVTMCPYPRATAHVPYLADGMHDPNNYAVMAESLLLEGICRGVDEAVVVDCLSPTCQSRNYDNRTLQHTVVAWERGQLYVSAAQEAACSDFFTAELNAVYAWQREHDSMEPHRKQVCGSTGKPYGASPALLPASQTQAAAH